MKLAEALINRADLQKSAAYTKRLILANSKVQIGDEPVEAPSELIKVYGLTMKTLEKLISRINKTNSLTALSSDSEFSIADAIAMRDSLNSKIKTYGEICDAASVLRDNDRYRERENTKYKACVNIKELRTEIDEMSKRFRQLDTAIQAANWATELL